jgi:platelet-activating factor acetylhydrolase isoform II
VARMVNRIVKRVAKAVGILALIAVAGLAVLLAALWVDHGRSTPLPAPSGRYKVGRTTYIWRDETRVNPYAPVAGTRQDLAVWIRYPAAPTSSPQKSEYLPGYWIRALQQHEGFILARLLSRDLTRVETHSWTDAEVSSEQAMYPVIILRAGGGALSSDYTTLTEDLASHGYIVVSLDAPYRTVITAFPDGRVATRASGGDFDRMLPSSATQHLATQLMSVWIEDLKFVLDQLLELNANDPTGRFKGKFDMRKVGIAGHSLGGATAAQFCHDDSRCAAGIDIDGMPFGKVIQEGIHRPFFFLMSDHSRESGSEPQTVERNIESIYDRVPEGKRWGMTMMGANHFTFSDQMFTKSPILMFFLRRAGVMGSLEKRRGLAITGACVHTFFDVYLKGAPVEEMNNLPDLYPELKIGVTTAFPHQQAH